MERTAWARDRNFGIGEHQGVQLISLAAGELKIRRLMVALDRALDRCEEIMRRTGHPILFGLTQDLVIDLTRDHSHFWEKQQLVKDIGGFFKDSYHSSFEPTTWPQLWGCLR